MAAEAHNRKTNPDDTKALEYLNRVRTRAFETQIITQLLLEIHLHN